MCVVISGFHSDITDSNAELKLASRVTYITPQNKGVSSESDCCTPFILAWSLHSSSIPSRWWGTCPNCNDPTARLCWCAACIRHTTSAALFHYGLHDGSLKDALDMLMVGKSRLIVTILKTLDCFSIAFCCLCQPLNYVHGRSAFECMHPASMSACQPLPSVTYCEWQPGTVPKTVTSSG